MHLQVFVPWLQLMSFSVWFGANVLLLGILLPASGALPPAERARTLSRAGRALNAVVALAAPVTVVSGAGGVWLTGYAGPSSGAFLTLAAKALLMAVMIVNHSLQAFRYRPSLEHPPDGRDPWTRLLAANVTLGAVVLLLGLL